MIKLDEYHNKLLAYKDDRAKLLNTWYEIQEVLGSDKFENFCLFLIKNKYYFCPSDKNYLYRGYSKPIFDYFLIAQELGPLAAKKVVKGTHSIEYLYNKKEYELLFEVLEYWKNDYYKFNNLPNIDFFKKSLKNANPQQTEIIHQILLVFSPFYPIYKLRKIKKTLAKHPELLLTPIRNGQIIYLDMKRKINILRFLKEIGAIKEAVLLLNKLIFVGMNDDFMSRMIKEFKKDVLTEEAYAIFVNQGVKPNFIYEISIAMIKNRHEEAVVKQYKKVHEILNTKSHLPLLVHLSDYLTSTQELKNLRSTSQTSASVKLL